MLKKIYYWLPVFLWCSLIFYLSGVPYLKTELGYWDFILRKIAHIVEYGILFLLVQRALFHSGLKWQPKRIYLVSIIFSVLYAVSDEYHQSFVPGRGPSAYDVGVDSAGVFLFYLYLSNKDYLFKTLKTGMKSNIVKLMVLLLSICSFYACGPNYQFSKASKLEKKGFYVEAALEYEKVSDKYPDHPKAPESLYRIGCIFQKNLKVYSQARLYFNRLLDRYSELENWKHLAELGLFNSPDYFPLNDGNFWIEGDSKTGGRNMQSKWACKQVSTDTFHIKRSITAGKSFVTSVSRYFRKQSFELREYTSEKSKRYTIIISYPFKEGRTWKTVRDNRGVDYLIVSNGVSVDVKAGKFRDCLKVRERYNDLPGSVKFNYYAPEVGWVLTTTAKYGGKEHRSSELLSYNTNPAENVIKKEPKKEKVKEKKKEKK
ncbi:MAG: VanZ family protein [Endomicrobiales bacterium]|nr:VanZ family protein [Endomicrobiales bacterium]